MLEPTKKAVLEWKAMLDEAGVADQDGGLRAVAAQAFYNTSHTTIHSSRSTCGYCAIHYQRLYRRGTFS